MPAQIERAVDQPDMTIGLRKIAQHAAGTPIYDHLARRTRVEGSRRGYAPRRTLPPRARRRLSGGRGGTGRFVHIHSRLACGESRHRRLHSAAPVYFEEWDDPLISGIGWVSELIEIAGGEDVFRNLRNQKAASGRIVSSDAVIAAKPDVILASWCGKKVVPGRIRQRPGWSEIPAVTNDRIIEIKSPLILQPGPAALTDGLDAILVALGNG
jgi:Periplasmic binding protein